MRSGSIDVIVVDSVAALIPKKEIEGDMGDANIAMQARLMSQVRPLTSVASCCVVHFHRANTVFVVVHAQSLRKLLSSMHHSKTCMLIFLNQVSWCCFPVSHVPSSGWAVWLFLLVWW